MSSVKTLNPKVKLITPAFVILPPDKKSLGVSDGQCSALGWHVIQLQEAVCNSCSFSSGGKVVRTAGAVCLATLVADSQRADVWTTALRMLRAACVPGRLSRHHKHRRGDSCRFGPPAAAPRTALWPAGGDHGQGGGPVHEHQCRKGAA